MIRSRYFHSGLFCLVAFGLHAQGQGPDDPAADPWQQNSGLDASGGLSQQEVQALATERSRHREWASTANHLWMNKLQSVPKVREMLAQEWRHMGIPAEQATVIASAYSGQNRPVRHASLRGMNGKEVAAMLQSALESKDYPLANQLLIDYERDRLASEKSKNHR